MFLIFIMGLIIYTYDIQYNMVKSNLKGSAVLLWFRDSFSLKIAKVKKNSRLDISFGSYNRFGLNIFGLTALRNQYLSI